MLTVMINWWQLSFRNVFSYQNWNHIIAIHQSKIIDKKRNTHGRGNQNKDDQGESCLAESYPKGYILLLKSEKDPNDSDYDEWNERQETRQIYLPK